MTSLISRSRCTVCDYLSSGAQRLVKYLLRAEIQLLNLAISAVFRRPRWWNPRPMHPSRGTSRLHIGLPSALMGFGTSGTHLEDPATAALSGRLGSRRDMVLHVGRRRRTGKNAKSRALFGTLRTQASAFLRSQTASAHQ